MKKIKLVSSIALATTLFSGLYAAGGATSWGYKGETNPSNWGSLDKKYSMCSKGMVQTPIDIQDVKDVDLKPLDLNYTVGSKSIINNGHTVQVNIENGDTFKIKAEEYNLLQFHFHTPSENSILGKIYPLEAHFVHATKDGKLAVIGVMFDYGKANPTLEKIWNAIPKEVGHTEDLKLSVDDVKSLMSDTKDYYRFMGSLTTPPCSENVTWSVLKKPLSISPEQVQKFFKLYNYPNNRPLQKVNKREILG